MNIVNMMWAGGTPYMSIHKVHRQVLSNAGADARISNWLLLGSGLCCGLGSTREWHMPSRALKGRHLWRLLRPWLRMRLRKALAEAGAEVVLLDGIGVARLVLPLLQRIGHVRAKVLFHGKTRLHASDIRLLQSFPSERLSIAAVSQTLAESLERDLGRPVQTLRMALDPLAFVEPLLNRDQARQALKLPQDAEVMLGAVGRLVESKGFEMLIEAFARASARQPACSWRSLARGRSMPCCSSVSTRWAWPSAFICAVTAKTCSSCIEHSTGYWYLRVPKAWGWWCKRR